MQKVNKCWPCIHYDRRSINGSLVFREQCLIGENLGTGAECELFEYEPGSDVAVAYDETAGYS